MDADVGRLFGKFTLGTTTLGENNKFRGHILDCLYCATLLTNFEHTREASEYYGVPVGPDLDQYLSKVPLYPVTDKLMKAAGEMVGKLSRKKPKERVH